MAIMEPLSAVALSLALGAAAVAGKEVVSESVKDSYAVLKEIIRSRYPKIWVEQLERAPDSKALRAVVEEGLMASNAGEDATLLAAARNLIDLIQSHAPDAAGTVGIDLQDVRAANIRLTDIRSPTGDVQISGAVAGTGNNIVGGAVTGVRPIDPWPTPGRERR